MSVVGTWGTVGTGAPGGWQKEISSAVEWPCMASRVRWKVSLSITTVALALCRALKPVQPEHTCALEVFRLHGAEHTVGHHEQ